MSVFGWVQKNVRVRVGTEDFSHLALLDRLLLGCFWVTTVLPDAIPGRIGKALSDVREWYWVYVGFRAPCLRIEPTEHNPFTVRSTSFLPWTKSGFLC